MQGTNGRCQIDSGNAPGRHVVDFGVSRDQWRKTGLAAMANYNGAGSIVAGAVALPIWPSSSASGTTLCPCSGR
jgi:hypothetical protein